MKRFQIVINNMLLNVNVLNVFFEALNKFLNIKTNHLLLQMQKMIMITICNIVNNWWWRLGNFQVT